MANRNKLIVPQSASLIDEIKYEIANEFGVYDFGAYATARGNGSVGGEITKRLVKMAESALAGQQQQ
ncbi:alpha/beta-type small acid-soluble spore protein [Ammoniphilus sp. CFH 90114]|uniref:alpha/beta-type small acid-soluble spore protein n=1 Tax=Ammoniphilus sp. CFH 90114 TaxID=2493665 RepID=UPI00100EA4C1|nr:alpha/beta-type small acid-soluble spore protein [Ammoniphilus sp. CFH 90114]RXT04740.1 alpha/beta-type small acid-soluble spore protein [Ammoniphilus sp. CFH 90114]